MFWSLHQFNWKVKAQKYQILKMEDTTLKKTSAMNAAVQSDKLVIPACYCHEVSHIQCLPPPAKDKN